MTQPDPSIQAPWWRGATVYQIYPRSFADGNGDGHGDLKGILNRLDYVAELGVDAVWLSPIYPSPNRDWGYDVSDYTGIHPDFGTMADFDLLLRETHDRGLRLILDHVLSHTSDEHAWFADSVASGDKRDWYVWAEPRLDGTVPNNWLSVFGGPAWSYHPARRQYYFHKFYRQQPKLNLYEPACRRAVLDVLRFWFDRGVDGYRLDVANSFLHDAELRDNPAVPMDERSDFHWGHAPRLQRHTRDANLERNIEVLTEIRELTDGYQDRWVFGEFSEEPGLLPLFADPERGLHSGYTFDFLESNRFDAALMTEFYGRHGGDRVWPCVTFSNHDVPRVATRLSGASAGESVDDRIARYGLALLLALRGTVLLYQGEELGLEEGDIPHREQIRDPIGDLYYPYFKGRDGCRTPMPWEPDGTHLGFSEGEPWLPVAPAHKRKAAHAQTGDPGSIRAAAKAMIAARKDSAALRHGTLRLLDAPGLLVAFERVAAGERLAAVFHPDPSETAWPMPPGDWAPVDAFCQSASYRDGTVRLGPWGTFLARHR